MWIFARIKNILAAIGLVKQKQKPTLLTLPGEVRNRIYGFLILPINASLKVALCEEDGKVHLYHQLGDGNHDSFGFDGDLRPTARSHIHLRDSEQLGQHDYGDLICAYLPAVVLLRTCRQINVEFGRLFWRKMRFTMTHVARVIVDEQHPSLMYMRSDTREFHNREGKAFKSFGNWTKVMGTQISYIGLTSVTIDLRTLCPMFCEGHQWPYKDSLISAWYMCEDKELDVTPYLFAMWNSNRPLDVSIICTEPHGDQSLLEHNSSRHPVCDILNLEDLHETLESLVDDDDLKLQGREWPVVRVRVLRRGYRGEVVFRYKDGDTVMYNHIGIHLGVNPGLWFTYGHVTVGSY